MAAVKINNNSGLKPTYLNAFSAPIKKYSAIGKVGIELINSSLQDCFTRPIINVKIETQKARFHNNNM